MVTPSTRGMLARQGHYDTGIHDELAALVGGAEHQGGHAVKTRHHRHLGEHHPREGTREAGEDDAGEQGDGQDAAEAFRRHQQVGVKRPGRHHAIAQGPQGLDAEEESVREAAGPGIGDAMGVECVEQGEDQIDGDEGGRQFQEEPWPGDGQHLVVEVHEAARSWPFTTARRWPRGSRARLRTCGGTRGRGLRPGRFAHVWPAAFRYSAQMRSFSAPSWCR